MVKNGTRLQSQVDETQVIVVRAADILDDLRCGGAPMVMLGMPGAGTSPDPAFAGGTTMGKRYVADGGAEVLVTRAGVGTLTIGTTPLEVKNAKPLPASD